jgi:macrodomain Ter protein organizer (MatP/YcbG family)
LYIREQKKKKTKYKTWRQKMKSKSSFAPFSKQANRKIRNPKIKIKIKSYAPRRQKPFNSTKEKTRKESMNLSCMVKTLLFGEILQNPSELLPVLKYPPNFKSS